MHRARDLPQRELAGRPARRREGRGPPRRCAPEGPHLTMPELSTAVDLFDRVTARRRARRLSGLRSIEDVRAAARRALPPMVFDFIDGGAEDESTVRANQQA